MGYRHKNNIKERRQLKGIDFGIEPEGTFLDEYRLTVELKILKNFIHDDGIGIGNLAKIVGIDRKNIRPYLETLMKKEFIFRNGARGKFFRGRNFFKKSRLSSFILADLFASELLRQENVILANLKPRFPNLGIEAMLPNFKKEQYGLHRAIFEFSARVGAYITYIIIRALDSQNEYYKDLKYLDSDSMSTEWVRQSISHIVKDLLFSFKDAVRFHLDTLAGGNNDHVGALIDFEWKLPQFRLKKEAIDEIILAYGRIYPLMYVGLEKLRNMLPNEIKEYENHLEYVKILQKYQKKCNHDYVANFPRLIEFEGHKFWTTWWLKHCKRCHHTIY